MSSCKNCDKLENEVQSLIDDKFRIIELTSKDRTKYYKPLLDEKDEKIAELKAENDRLKNQANADKCAIYGHFNWAMEIIVDNPEKPHSFLIAIIDEIKSLQSELQEYKDSLARTIADDHDKDEIHCGCCVELRCEVKRLKAEKEDNHTRAEIIISSRDKEINRLHEERKSHCCCVFNHEEEKTILVESCKFHSDEINSLQSEIEKLKSCWVSVDDLLPDDSGFYMTADGVMQDEVHEYWYDIFTQNFIDGSESINVTHWMPLPQPPEDNS